MRIKQPVGIILLVLDCLRLLAILQLLAVLRVNLYEGQPLLIALHQIALSSTQALFPLMMVFITFAGERYIVFSSLYCAGKFLSAIVFGVLIVSTASDLISSSGFLFEYVLFLLGICSFVFVYDMASAAVSLLFLRRRSVSEERGDA